MGKRIIVAGLGHGGISAAAILSKNGYDVTVYEQKSEGTLGYDWTDIFAPDALDYAGIPMPPKDKYTYKENMTFFGPSEHVGYTQHVPDYDLEIKLERKDIYNHLIQHAVNCGVKIEYDCTVNSAITVGNRVIGISTSKGDVYGDLIIDACGMNSPVRKSLPDYFNIQKEIPRHERITIYRAFYNKACNEDVKAKFKVCLLKDGITGIAWVASEENHIDLLIGRFNDFDINEVNRFADILRKTNPTLGTDVIRGGQFVNIPVRQPLSMMVADGYAAIGDSAFMTVPIIGSGIANSLKASKMLADTIINDKNDSFCKETLWNYQYNFYKKLGSGLAPLAMAKLVLLNLTPDEADYVFDSGLINEDNVTIGASFTGISKMNISLKDLLDKAKKGIKKPDLLLKLAPYGVKIGSAIAVCSAIPKCYSPKLVNAWREKYDKTFEIKE